MGLVGEMSSKKKLQAVVAISNEADALPGSSKMTEEASKIIEGKSSSGTKSDSSIKKVKITEDFTDKERIRMEEEGLSEKDFQKIPVSDDDCADFESINPHNESCWTEKDLVKLEDLGNWTENLSPRSEEDNIKCPEEEAPKAKAKRPMKRKRRKAQETSKKVKTD